MGFFEKRQHELGDTGAGQTRLPPGQYVTERFPVLHDGPTPDYGDCSGWDFRAFGLVAEPFTLGFDEFRALPTQEVLCDIHCVTRWSKLDTRWEGVSLRRIAEMAQPLGEASHVIVHCEHGYTTNLPIEDMLGPDVLLAYRYEGEELEPEHGRPLRLLLPRLYFWKSAKWVRGVEFLDHDEAGYWEQRGYHNYGDPWREQRYSDEDW